MAREVGLPSTTVHEILVRSHLQTHRLRTFTFSPDFEAKLLDIVGLYLDPPENFLVLCVDEKTGIQALDRIQPLLPLRAKKPRAWTNEYVRHGTQTLLAALKIATGEVLSHIRQRRSSSPATHSIREKNTKNPRYKRRVSFFRDCAGLPSNSRPFVRRQQYTINGQNAICADGCLQAPSSVVAHAWPQPVVCMLDETGPHWVEVNVFHFLVIFLDTSQSAVEKSRRSTTGAP